MNNKIYLREFKDKWIKALDDLKSNFLPMKNEVLMNGPNIDISDLFEPKKEEYIEDYINETLKYHIEPEKRNLSHETKIDIIKSIEGDNLEFVKEVQKNINTIRTESLDVAINLTNKTMKNAIDFDHRLSNVNIHSIRDINEKCRLSPREKNYILNPVPIIKSKEIIQNFNALIKYEIIVNVTIYNSFTGKKNQEFMVLGSQYLTELKDKIYCLTDQLETKNGSFFFIENIFYNDTRNKLNEDYSADILYNQEKKHRYYQSMNSKINEEIYGKKNMQDVTFEDLTIVIGKPYIYRHQEACDHMIIFNDVRLKDRDDPIEKINYPLNIFQSRIHRKKCNACMQSFSKVLCFNDKVSNIDPCYFCETCYFGIHYNTEGKLKYKDFQIYPYIHEQQRSANINLYVVNSEIIFKDNDKEDEDDDNDKDYIYLFNDFIYANVK